ncbi:hypothetical protein GCM10027290_13960 [Micromonospora sonneratiae]|uniref:Uncharacterized protein n=1 Tax=Micromonospora sonneratiae TaxID=1184706 RepID=A0ABW3YRJ3_9ACTN
MGNETSAQREYGRQTADDQSTDQPDVLLDVPGLNIDALDLEATDLRAKVSLNAEVLNLLRLNVGIDLSLGQVRLDLRGVGAQALLKVRLDQVAEIVNRMLTSVDTHPELIESLVRTAATSGQQAAQGGQGQAQGGQGQQGQQGQGQQGQQGQEGQGQQGQGQEQGEGGQAQGKKPEGQGQGQEGQGQDQPQPQGDGQDQAGRERAIEACATVDLESRRSGDPRPPAGLPRRARRRW